MSLQTKKKQPQYNRSFHLRWVYWKGQYNLACAFQTTSSRTLEFDYNDGDDDIEKLTLETAAHGEWVNIKKCITKLN